VKKGRSGGGSFLNRQKRGKGLAGLGPGRKKKKETLIKPPETNRPIKRQTQAKWVNWGEAGGQGIKEKIPKGGVENEKKKTNKPKMGRNKEWVKRGRRNKWAVCKTTISTKKQHYYRRDFEKTFSRKRVKSRRGSRKVRKPSQWGETRNETKT